jgi:hypothetical protein
MGNVPFPASEASLPIFTMLPNPCFSASAEASVLRFHASLMLTSILDHTSCRRAALLLRGDGGIIY